MDQYTRNPSIFQTYLVDTPYSHIGSTPLPLQQGKADKTWELWAQSLGTLVGSAIRKPPTPLGRQQRSHLMLPQQLRASMCL